MRSRVTRGTRNGVVRCEQYRKKQSAGNASCCTEFAIESHDARIYDSRIRVRARYRKGTGEVQKRTGTRTSCSDGQSWRFSLPERLQGEWRFLDRRAQVV
jgi:hypothetical protein